MISVVKAKAGDFKRVEPLLTDHNKVTDWSQLFTDHWNIGNDFLGFLLLDNDDVVGFLGIILSKRMLNGVEHNFCNLSTWVVKPEYKSKSMLLFFKVLQLKDYTITDLTATKEVYALSKKLGFKEFETHQRQIVALPRIHKLFAKSEFITNSDEIESLLKDKSDSKVFQDHRRFKCLHTLLKVNSDLCYFITIKTSRHQIPVGFIQYVSNRELFLKYIDNIKLFALMELKLLSLFIDERYVAGREIVFSIKKERFTPRLYKSYSLSSRDMDTLYSELMIFNMGE